MILKKLFIKNIAIKRLFFGSRSTRNRKTSSLIKSIVETLYHQTDENLLLTAYTNRAVDELCHMLNGAHIPFIRLGSKDSTHFQEHTVYSIVDEYGIEGLRNSIHNNRVCVSTVSSLQTNSEIFDLKTFSTVIIDEAAQLLEPQVLGIISKVKRFIMIGDEKQLPAIVQQDARGALLNNPLLESIECTDLRLSLFERLLIICKKMNGIMHLTCFTIKAGCIMISIHILVKNFMIMLYVS